MGIVDTIIEEVKKSIVTVVVRENFKMLCLEYDKDNKIFKTTIYIPYKPKKAVIGEEKARTELAKISPSALNTAYEEIKNEIKQYDVVKERLKRLAIKNFSASELEKILKFLDVVCVPYRYAGNNNSFTINKNTHIRLTSTPDWDKTGELHLQKYIRNEDEILDTQYPKQSELDILKEIVCL